MIIDILRIFSIIATAIIVGKLMSKIKMPAILGWLITGIVFGPYIVGLVSEEIMNATWYKIFIKTFECFAGVMIGTEIVFKQLKKYGKQITIITFFQSLGTFAFVTIAFAITFAIAKLPIFPAFIFGGIALATAPAPALSIVNEFKTDAPVTKTLIPMAALDDIIGIVVFMAVITIISSVFGGNAVSPLNTVLSILLPFIIGIPVGIGAGFAMKKVKNSNLNLLFMILGLIVCIVLALVCDKFIFKSFMLNYFLIGMAYSSAVSNIVPKEKNEEVLKKYNPLLTLSFVIVIVSLGMPLDYHFILGAGIFTVIYILARAIGKIGASMLGGYVCKAEKPVTKFLGLTLLPHSGVSLVFTGIAVTTMLPINPEVAGIIQGTITAAAIINEIIAVIVARQAFKWAGEIDKKGTKNAPVLEAETLATESETIENTAIESETCDNVQINENTNVDIKN